jgi:acetate kinase
MTSLLALNAGSSSLKFALYNGDGLAELARGKIEEVGPDVHLIIHGADGAVLDERRWEGRCHEDVLPDLLEWIELYPQAGVWCMAGRALRSRSC